MNILPSCWLGNQFDTADRLSLPYFEDLLRDLFNEHADPNQCEVYNKLQTMEQKILLRKIALSRRQAARFWVKAARYYTRIDQPSASFEAYDLCSRVLDRRELCALFMLHSEWAAVAHSLGFDAQTDQSYEYVMRYANELARIPDSGIQANEDNPVYLEAIKWRSTRTDSE